MKSERVYLQPKEIVYRGMLDLMDTQKVREIKNDSARESIRFSVMMFDTPWELRFTAVPIGRTRCVATLGIKTEVDVDERLGITFVTWLIT